ncbi:hypothetical protein H6P81_016492 [Aristolochia fimbriata]|uniref:Uncharacterized protein n=1 Tax=Aristolochia fimbriata TaxID=158543 RepID=A0AAV7EC95_ARIFI|nr:hypothetical protein H6P81_016492 [Aristolochia fimbriata]
MAKLTPTVFLEEWLRNSVSLNTSQPSSSSQNPSAQTIIQSWSYLRDCHHQNSVQSHHLQSLETLNLSSQTSLHVADPQAKLLLSLLSLAPQQSHHLIFRLLYIWARKASNPSPSLLESLVPVLSRCFSERTYVDDQLIARGALLLGAISVVSRLSQASRSVCLELLSRLVEEDLHSTRLRQVLVAEVLAGIGYALVCSERNFFIKIFNCLLGIWRRGDGLAASLTDGLMLLHLMEWVISGFASMHSVGKLEVVGTEIEKSSERSYPHFSVVMACAGTLRAINQVQSGSRFEVSSTLRNLLEDRISSIALDLLIRTENFSNTSSYDHSCRLSLSCISLGLARIGHFSFRNPVLLCLVTSLLIEVFPLPSLCRRANGRTNGVSYSLELREVKEHLNSLLFREAGSVTNIFCNQYVLAREEDKLIVESYLWKYCEETYSALRAANFLLKNERNGVLVELEKIAEAAFLMVVVFSSVVVKHKVNSNTKYSIQTQSEVSVRVLVAFSCLEYMRRVRLPEYSETIQAIVKSVQQDRTASVSFIKSMPPYLDLTSHQAFRKIKYSWSEDEVQMARVLFYLRVIPTCIEYVPHHEFGKIVAPTMFLYMRHSSAKVTRASHLLFASFISSGIDANQDERILLKEQLVFYYMRRALEAYPEITPYEGMVSGVTALVRHLPAGSPAILYSVHCLAEHATRLCRETLSQDANFWMKWQGDMELPSKKILELLLRLISLVDIQTLPDLLKLLAQFVAQLPQIGQNLVLDKIYSHVEESDDVTRKPSLVSWLHSVSYLSSTSRGKDLHGTTTTTATAVGSNRESESDTISLNNTRARI